MHEAQDGEFSYAIDSHRFKSGEATWIWQVRHTDSGCFVDAGTSPHSHDHARTEAFTAMADAESKSWPGAAPNDA
jgi:hypothetical protein